MWKGNAYIESVPIVPTSPPIADWISDRSMRGDEVCLEVGGYLTSRDIVPPLSVRAVPADDLESRPAVGDASNAMQNEVDEDRLSDAGSDSGTPGRWLVGRVADESAQSDAEDVQVEQNSTDESFDAALPANAMNKIQIGRASCRERV